MASWFWWMILGILFIAGGVFGLLNPLAATFSAVQVIGWIVLAVGIFTFAAVFHAIGWGQRLWTLVLSVAYIWLGLSLLFRPLEGILTLTLVVAALFLVSGVAKVIFAFLARRSGYFWPALFSGVVSVALAAMVIFNFPQSAAVLLGVLLAVELIATGAALVFFALFQRQVGTELAEAA
jgi:uncharacterized membrane protein HdeD (DUF308 family)